MRFVLFLVLSLITVLGALTPATRLSAQPKQLPPNLVAPTDPLAPADERKQFTVPAGFDVQLVASEPDIQKPMQMAFDAKGRMWVTTSYHYPFAAENGKATDKLFILSEFDPQTGKAGKVQKFAEDLNIPIGILPLPDCKSCIVSSTGEIRRYTDTDGDGKADKSEVLFTGFGVRDTHGMYNSYTLMPDGWVYSCHGFNNDSTVKGKDGHEVKMHSGHTFRFKPDGSRIEVWTRGQVNPFGIAIDPWFNLYTADCHSKPITQLVPGAYYESFGKPHDGLGFTPAVTAHPHKSTGLCGLSWYDADHFPKEYLGHLFLGDVVSNCVSLDKVVWKGSTPVAVEQPDFLKSKDRWFRPVDIKLGPDGALYVADFYNKVIGHYEVDLKHPGRDKERGRIWRIVWTGKDGKVPAPKFHRADFTKATDAELIDDLSHPNLTVRFLAGHQLRRRIVEGKDPIGETAPAFAKVLKTPDLVSAYVGWLSFIVEAGKEPVKVKDYADFLAYVQNPKNTLKPEHATGHLIRALASRPKWDTAERAIVLDVFKSFDGPHMTRAAVEAAGLHPHADFVEPLVAVLKKCPAEDVLLRQAARIALRNCLRDADAWPKEYEAVYADMALAIPNQKASEYLLAHIGTQKVPASKLPASAEHVARYGTVTTEAKLFELLSSSQNADAVLAAFKGVQARGTKLSPETTKHLLQTAETAIGADAKAVLWGLRVLNALPAVADRGALKLTADSLKALGTAVGAAKAPDEVRIGAADALLRYAPAESISAVRKQLAEPTTPEAVRVGFLLVFAASNVPGAQVEARDALKDLPYRVAVPIGLSFASTKEGADILLTAVKQGKAPARLLQEKAILERLKASNFPGWEKTVTDLTKGLPPADQRLANLIKQRGTGFATAKVDKVEGAKLFTKHCAACHKIGDMGGKIAPQLDGIGLRGLERLLEDTLDPNRNVDQAFRARSITTSDDRTITALMLRVEGEVLVVADLEGKEKRIPMKDITTNRETLLSAMPANFDTVVPETDFYHIVAYLLDQKTKDPPPKK